MNMTLRNMDANKPLFRTKTMRPICPFYIIASFGVYMHIYYINASTLNMILKWTRCSLNYLNRFVDRPIHDLSYHTIVLQIFVVIKICNIMKNRVNELIRLLVVNWPSKQGSRHTYRHYRFIPDVLLFWFWKDVYVEQIKRAYLFFIVVNVF